MLLRLGPPPSETFDRTDRRTQLGLLESVSDLPLGKRDFFMRGILVGHGAQSAEVSTLR